MLPIRRFLQTMDVVRREGEHLGYSRGRVFGQPVDAQWVRELEAAPELAERLEALAESTGSQIEILKGAPRPMDPLILSGKLESLRRCVSRIEQRRADSADALRQNIDHQDNSRLLMHSHPPSEPRQMSTNSSNTTA
jgi:Fe2+ transport system protein FeoA